MQFHYIHTRSNSLQDASSGKTILDESELGVSRIKQAWLRYVESRMYI